MTKTELRSQISNINFTSRINNGNVIKCEGTFDIGCPFSTRGTTGIYVDRDFWLHDISKTISFMFIFDKDKAKRHFQGIFCSYVDKLKLNVGDIIHCGEEENITINDETIVSDDKSQYQLTTKNIKDWADYLYTNLLGKE